MNGSPSHVPGGNLLDTDKQILTNVESVVNKLSTLIPEARGEKQGILYILQTEDSLIIIEQKRSIDVESN